MGNQKLMKLNSFIKKAYECFSFMEFLKLAIIGLHEVVMDEKRVILTVPSNPIKMLPGRSLCHWLTVLLVIVKRQP